MFIPYPAIFNLTEDLLFMWLFTKILFALVGHKLKCLQIVLIYMILSECVFVAAVDEMTWGYLSDQLLYANGRRQGKVFERRVLIEGDQIEGSIYFVLSQLDKLT